LRIKGFLLWFFRLFPINELHPKCLDMLGAMK